MTHVEISHDPQGDYIAFLEKENDELMKLNAHLKMMFPDPKKLRFLASWFDKYDKKNKITGKEVQDDFRLWADNATKILRG